jgi:hypothetical protein
MFGKETRKSRLNKYRSSFLFDIDSKFNAFIKKDQMMG